VRLSCIVSWLIQGDRVQTANRGERASEIKNAASKEEKEWPILISRRISPDQSQQNQGEKKNCTGMGLQENLEPRGGRNKLPEREFSFPAKTAPLSFIG